VGPNSSSILSRYRQPKGNAKDQARPDRLAAWSFLLFFMAASSFPEDFEPRIMEISIDHPFLILPV